MLPAGLWEKIQGDEYEVLRAWVEELTARPSFEVSSWDGVVIELTRLVGDVRDRKSVV